MTSCAYAQAENSYAALQKLLKEVREELDVEQWDYLKKAQAAWEQMRDNDCAFFAYYSRMGSIQQMIYWLCISDRNVERIEKLKNLLCSVYLPEECVALKKNGSSPFPVGENQSSKTGKVL